MLYSAELLEAVEQSPAGPLEVIGWRHMFGGRQPDQENNGGARWNPPGVPAIYLSTTREGAVAEGDHMIDVQPYRPRARRFVYRVELTLSSVVMLRTAEDLARVGLTSADIVSDDHSACRQVGGAVAWLERDGLLVPSARSDAANLVVYPNNRAADARFEYGDGQELLS